MADTKISALTLKATPVSTDRIPIAQSPYGSGDNRYITPDAIAAMTGGLPLQMPIQTNRYYLPPGRTGAVDVTTVTNTTIRMSLFQFAKVDTFTRIGLNVALEAVGGLFRIGVYAAGSDGMPTGAALVNSELDCSTSGEKEATISFLPTAGQKYWVGGIANDAAIQFTIREVGGHLHGEIFGCNSPDDEPAVYWRASGQTYGSLPTAPSGSLIDGNPPLVWLRKV